MTFPEKGTMIPFGEAQAAIAAVSEAYNAAIESTIKDEALKVKLMAAVAGNVFSAMLSRVQTEGPAATSGEFDSLFGRLFGT